MVYLAQGILRPYHIAMQILADNLGNAVHSIFA